jgi:YD repeat-containing protein
VIGLVSERLGRIRLTRDADGRLTALEAAGLRRWWRHDDRGLLIGYTEQLGSEVPRATRLNRDANGRVVDETGPRGEQALLGYDEVGRLIARVDPTGVVRYGYDAAGHLIEERRAGAPTRRYVSDGAHRLVRIETGRAGEPGAGTVLIETDAAGRRLAERRGDEVRRFRYGPLGHLIGIDHGDAGDTDGPATTLAVDAFGHLVGIADLTLAWAPGPARRRVPDRFGDLHLHSIAGQPVALTDVAATDGGVARAAGSGKVARAAGSGEVARAAGSGEVRWISTDWRGAVDPGDDRPAGTVTVPSVAVDGLEWTGTGFHDPATGRDLAPGAWWPGRGSEPRARRRRPRDDAVARGARVGHWDVGAVIRRLVLDEVGEIARSVMADAYDLTGLPGADPGGDVSAVAVRLLTGAGDDQAGGEGPVPTGDGFGNSAFPALGRRS